MWCAFFASYIVAWVIGAWAWWPVFLVLAVGGLVATVQQLRSVAPHLSRSAPKMPLGLKRSVVFNPKTRISADAAGEDLGGDTCGDFSVCHWLATSAMIVPYESLVVFCDSRLEGERKAGMVLSMQEKQHSAVHGRYNAHFFNGGTTEGAPPSFAMPRATQMVFLGYQLLLQTIIPPLNAALPAVVDGMVAITEHGFFHSFSREGVFDLLSPDAKSPALVTQRAPLLSKMFLWHMGEEIEHCVESTHGFHCTRGAWAVPLLIVAYPLVSLFWFSVTVWFVCCTFGFALNSLPLLGGCVPCSTRHLPDADSQNPP